MQLSLNDDSIREAVRAAVFDALGPVKREELLRKAIADLLEPKKPEYGSGPSRSELERAFSQAVWAVAVEEAKKVLDADSEFRSKLAELVRNVVNKAVDPPDDKVKKMAESFSTLLFGSPY